MKPHKILRLLGQADTALQRCLGIRTQGPDPFVILKKPPNHHTGSLEPHQLSDTRDTAFVNDVSGSMDERDCHPSRLGASKKAAQEYVWQRVGISPQDRIALVSFSDNAKVVLPLTEIGQANAIIKAIKKLKIYGGTDIAQGLKAAREVLLNGLSTDSTRHARNKHILMLTDGRGGHPIGLAKELKDQHVLIEVIGVGGDTSAVNEELLRKVATTDAHGFTHYWFINDTDCLVNHYRELATGIVMRDRQ